MNWIRASFAGSIAVGTTAFILQACLVDSPAEGEEVGQVPLALDSPSPLWGLLEGGQPMKGMYFFPGRINDDGNGNGPGMNELTYLPLAADMGNYHQWNSDAGSRAAIMSQIGNLGVNVIHLAYWYQPSPDLNPEHDYHCDLQDNKYCDLTWNSVVNTAMKIIPSMDGIGATPYPDGGPSLSNPQRFGRPGDRTHYNLIESAVRRWLLPEADASAPKYPNKWQRMYDRAGNLRYAIELLDVGGDNIVPPPGRTKDDAVVDVLDSIANEIMTTYRVPVGFLIDPGVGDPDCDPARPETCRYSPTPGRTRFENAASFLGILGWRNEAQSPSLYFCNLPPPGCDQNLAPPGPLGPNRPPGAPNDHNREGIARRKRARMAEWIAAGLPTILDVSPGYDGHLTWTRDGGYSGYVGDNGYGFDDLWRNYLGQFKGIGNVGIMITSWNGFGEGMAVMPGRRKPLAAGTSAVDEGYPRNSVRYEWVRRLMVTDPRACDYWHFVNSVATHHIHGDICRHWQTLGAQLGLETNPERSFEPVTSVIPSPAGNSVARFKMGAYADYYGFYSKNSAIGPHYVQGAIYSKYRALGEDSAVLGNRLPLGVPTTDELDSARSGKFNRFENGAIYWYYPVGSSTAITRLIWGAFDTRWGQLGWEWGSLGFPVTDPTPSRGGYYQQFEKGNLYWLPSDPPNPSSPAYEVTDGASGVLYDDVLYEYGRQGWENGFLGYPTSVRNSGSAICPAPYVGSYTLFQGGVIETCSNRTRPCAHRRDFVCR